jgi:D-alanine-D-alanine ligase
VHGRWNQPVIAEEYVEGREFYVTVLGNGRLTVLPPRECFFDSEAGQGPELVTYRVKWNTKYREKWKIRFGFAQLDERLGAAVERVCKKVYRVLELRDYARIDLRLTPENRIVVLEANPNPDLAYGEEVAEAAEKAGISYEALINRIIAIALRRYA